METDNGSFLELDKIYVAMLMSAAVDSDLIQSKSWQTKNFLHFDSTYNSLDFGGWLACNFVVDKNHKMWDIIRVANRKSGAEKIALVSLSAEGKKLAFLRPLAFCNFKVEVKSL